MVHATRRSPKIIMTAICVIFFTGLWLDSSAQEKGNVPSKSGKALPVESLPASAAQEQISGYGTIIGEITDAVTGEALVGATVGIKGTTYGTSTDIDGRYTFRRVPAGDQELIIRYMGYVSSETMISIEAGERKTLNMELDPDMIEGDEILVEAYQRGQSRALTRQRQSPNIRSILSSEQIDRTTSTTVSGALSRISGMHGGTNIRGVGSAMSNVTVDGQRMGTTGRGSRSVDLGTISADMVQELDVIKVITPDMDADALAGVINISTRRPAGRGQELNVRLGGGWDQRYLGNIGASNRASINYGNSPRDDFSYALNFSYQRSPGASEQLQTHFFHRAFDGPPMDVLSYIQTQLEFDVRDRYGMGLQMTFQPTDRTTYHIQGMFNFQDRERTSHVMRFDPNTSHYVSPNETRHPRRPGGDNVRYFPEMREYSIYQYTFQAGARHLFNSFDMEYKLGWGHGRYYEDLYGFRFQTPSDFESYFTFDDRLNPTVDFTNANHPRARAFNLIYADNRWDEHIDNEFSGTLDFQIPYTRGMVKFGGSARMTYKKGDHERYEMDYMGIVNLSNFDMVENSEWHLFGRTHHKTYHFPHLLDLQAAKDFYYHSYPFFNMDLETWAESSETMKFFANENTFASYGMAVLDFYRFRILAGARIEHTRNYYDGREGIIGVEGRYVGSNDVESRSDYTHLFPNAQITFNVGAMTNIRAAYSRSIGRPSFSQLSPYSIINYDQQTIRRGNPDLQPMVSDNIDLLFEHYFMNVGQLTLGFYYKSLSDFVYLFERRATEGEFEGWDERTFRNGEEGTVYGFEVAWQQNLDFLPGFLGNFSTFTNYTWSRSIADLDRDKDRYGTFPMPGQYPHIVNAGLDYMQGPFSGHVYYSWTTDVLAAYGSLRWVPEIQLRERVYFDRYNTGRNYLSASLRYRITRNMRIWADASGLLNTISMSYFYDKDHYPYTSNQMPTRSFSMGLRYSL